MESGILVSVVLPFALFIIMLGMGMSLVIDDFRRILKYPKAVIIGISLQMIILPLTGFIIVKIFNLPGLLAVGLMVLAFSPGGTTSNLFTYLAKGDLALSVSLTALVSLITPFSIPILTQISLSHFLGDSQEFSLPIIKTMLQLIVITIIPVSIGMFMNHKWPETSKKFENAVKYFSIIFLFLIITSIFIKNVDKMEEFFVKAGPAALTLNIVTMAIGFYVSKWLGVNRARSKTICIEVGIQNGTSALLITGTLLANNTMSIAPTIYSLIMFITGAGFGLLINSKKFSEESDLINA